MSADGGSTPKTRSQRRHKKKNSGRRQITARARQSPFLYDHDQGLFLKKKSSIVIKPTTQDTNEQEAIGGTVADPAACVVSMPPKYQHAVSSLGSEEWENYTK